MTKPLTPQSELRDLIIEVLWRAGGSAPRQTALQGIANLMRGRFLAGDLEEVRTRPGEAKWENRASYERAAMVRERLLRSDSPYGVWELTDLGNELHRKLAA